MGHRHRRQSRNLPHKFASQPFCSVRLAIGCIQRPLENRPTWPAVAVVAVVAAFVFRARAGWQKSVPGANRIALQRTPDDRKVESSRFLSGVACNFARRTNWLIRLSFNSGVGRVETASEEIHALYETERNQSRDATRDKKGPSRRTASRGDREEGRRRKSNGATIQVDLQRGSKGVQESEESSQTSSREGSSSADRAGRVERANRPKSEKACHDKESVGRTPFQERAVLAGHNEETGCQRQRNQPRHQAAAARHCAVGSQKQVCR